MPPLVLYCEVCLSCVLTTIAYCCPVLWVELVRPAVCVLVVHPCCAACCLPGSLQVHHRLFVCANAHEQKSNTQGTTTVVNITPGSERLSATGLKVC